MEEAPAGQLACDLRRTGGDGMVGGHLVPREHEMIQLLILEETRSAKLPSWLSRVQTFSCLGL